MSKKRGRPDVRSSSNKRKYTAVGNKASSKKKLKLNSDAGKLKIFKDREPVQKPLSGQQHEIKIPTVEELDEIRRRHFEKLKSQEEAKMEFKMQFAAPKNNETKQVKLETRKDLKGSTIY